MPDPAQLPIAAANRHARAVTTTYEAQHLIVQMGPPYDLDPLRRLIQA